MTAKYRVLRYDLRGHGRSPVPEEPITLADLGQDVLRLMDGLAIKRVHFCGLSLGGMVGQWLGLHAPERLHTLALVDTAPRMGSAEMWDERIQNIQQNGLEAIAQATMERWFTAKFRQQKAETVSQIRTMFLATPLDGYTACAKVVRNGVLAKDQLTQFNAVQTPTLVITGTEDTAATPAAAQQMVSFIRGAQYHELLAAHLSPVEAADEFGAVLEKFLKSHAG